jgi:hypothetical protein
VARGAGGQQTPTHINHHLYHHSPSTHQSPHNHTFNITYNHILHITSPFNTPLAVYRNRSPSQKPQTNAPQINTSDMTSVQPNPLSSPVRNLLALLGGDSTAHRRPAPPSYKQVNFARVSTAFSNCLRVRTTAWACTIPLLVSLNPATCLPSSSYYARVEHYYVNIRPPVRCSPRPIRQRTTHHTHTRAHTCTCWSK